MAILVTGAAGFIGSNLVRRLLAARVSVFGVDNLSRGRLDHLPEEVRAPDRFACIDMCERAAFQQAIERFHARERIDEVWHLAANSDIPGGVSDPDVDLSDTFMTTFNTLAVMKALGIKVIAFASSSAVYGDLGSTPLREDVGPLLPISNYGAMKLASEAAIAAAAESFLERSFIFRFPNVIGTPATHGVILDFVRKLSRDGRRLEVLGNGTQQKGYLHVRDLIGAMLHIRERSGERLALYNIGATDDGASVRFIAEETVRVAAPEATIEYGTADRGWVGDVPRFTYDVGKLQRLGWKPELGSLDAVRLAIRQIHEQERRGG